jgi:LysR family glycine cleavage system transcriptional activator
LPWLQELETDNVAEWFERHGIIPHRLPKITQMPGNLIMEAMSRGDGITHTVRSFFQNDVQSGRTIELYPERDFAIFYVVKAPGVMRQSVKTFLDWLLTEARVGVS